MSKFVYLVIFMLALSSVSAQIKWEPTTKMSGHLFPSYLYATVFFPKTPQALYNELSFDYKGDPNGQLGITLTKGELSLMSDFKLVISASEYWDEAVYEGNVGANEVGTFQIYPKVNYHWEVIKNLNSFKLLNVKFILYRKGYTNPEVKTMTIRFHAIHDCPYINFQEGDKAPNDLNWMYAGYVNEEHPLIQKEIIPLVTQAGFTRSVTGYQTGDAEEVVRQLLAVWTVLKQRGMRYSSISRKALAQGVQFQYVRTFEDSYSTRQGNCVDGSVLFASILSAMDLDPLLVLTPTHCFLGVYLDPPNGDPANRRMLFLETTMIDADIAPSQVNQANYNHYMDLAASNFAAIGKERIVSGFLAAVQRGLDNYNQDKDEFNNSIDFQILDISKLRRQGLGTINR